MMAVSCPRGTLHTVQPGESLFLIAQSFGITLTELLRANPQITDPNRIQVGQAVCIPGIVTPPPCPGFIYPVRPGETLFALARRFGTTVEAILAANPGVVPERLTVGQELCIPVSLGRPTCVVLSPTDIAPNAEAVAYLNPVTGRVFVMVTSVPRPEQLPGGEVYKVFLGRRESDDIAVATMTECLANLWVASFTPFFPVGEVQSVLVSAERRTNVGRPEGLGVATVILGPPA